jgi:hypothetical protein
VPHEAVASGGDIGRVSHKEEGREVEVVKEVRALEGPGLIRGAPLLLWRLVRRHRLRGGVHLNGFGTRNRLVQRSEVVDGHVQSGPRAFTELLPLKVGHAEAALPVRAMEGGVLVGALSGL